MSCVKRESTSSQSSHSAILSIPVFASDSVGLLGGDAIDGLGWSVLQIILERSNAVSAFSHPCVFRNFRLQLI